MTNTSTLRLARLAIGISILILAKTIYGEVASSREAVENYQKNLILGYYSSGALPFLVSAPKSEEIYNWGALAVVIKTIKCDGRNLLPFSKAVTMNRFDPGRRSLKDGRGTYLCALHPLISIQKYSAATGEYEADGYMIPPEFKNLVITYSIRYPNGETGEQQELSVAPD